MKSNSVFSRRTVLQGFGATLALPALEIMTGTTRAATQGGKDPGRLACFYIPGAINQYNWYPKDTGAEYTISKSHEPLSRHRDQFSVLSGLSHIEGRISGHKHPYNFLTGHNIAETPGVLTNSVSFDQVAAKYLGPTYLPSMALSWTSGVGAATLSRNSLGVDIPATNDYRKVFENLFPPADASQLKNAKERIALNRSILDTAVGDINALKRRLGTADQERIEQYLESIREVEKRLDDRDAILQQGRPQFDEKGVRLEPKAKNSMKEHLELMMDLIALAFQTDMTRVVTHSLGGEAGPNYSEYPEWAKETGAPTRGVHDYHHKGSGNRGADNPDTRLIGKRDQLYCACLSRLMDKLQSIKASDGTLLDHTTLMMGGSQISSHSGSNFPMLLAGGSKLGFKHGQHVKWKKDERSASDLYMTILQQLRCPIESFKESKSDLSEILA
ncbi:MAG: DUF1552 domain-containing protein [Akkermansiaceae bacterium]